MGNEITAMETLKEKVVNKVKESFAEMITDEQYTELVNKILDEYYKNQLPQLIKEEVQSMFRQQIKDELNNGDYDNYWNYDNGVSRQVPSEAIKTMIKELAPDLVVGLFSGVVADTVQRVRSEFNRY